MIGLVMRQGVLVGVLLALFSATPAGVFASEDDRALTSGLSLGVGAGHESAFLGAHALWYVQLSSSRWRLAPHVGVGGVPTLRRIAGAGGIMLAYGIRHRFVLDVLGGPFAARGESGERGHYDYGVGVLVGWEWMARYGLALRTTVGAAYRPGLPDEPIHLALNLLSIDYKLW